jgi:hypothetical protein
VVGNARPYLVLPSNDGLAVEAWSSLRLPYPAKGPMCEYLADLREALKAMRPLSAGALRATYGSTVPDRFDAENVLVYNVGGGHFAHLATRRLLVERGFFFVEPREPVEGAQHYCRYSAETQDAGFACWDFGAKLASWSRVPMQRLREETKPSSVWLAMKEADMDVARVARPDEAFGMSLMVGVPPDQKAAPSRIVKPLVDGIIAGLHCHDGTDLDELATRLHAQLPAISVDRIAELLSDETSAVLGRRELLWCRAASVQWNPADDLCLALELDIEPAERWMVSGHAYELVARE